MVISSPVVKGPGSAWYATALASMRRSFLKISRVSPATATDPIEQASIAGSLTAHSTSPNSPVAAAIAHATPGPLE